MTESQTIAPARGAAFVFIFVTVLLDMLALGAQRSNASASA